ncbi:MAG: diguanylate cyclase, partial [Chloroflexota bacterium]
VAYIPLLATAVGSRPLQRRHILFILFIIPAMLWSLTDYIFRSNFYPEQSLLLFKVLLIFYSAMVVQFHCFLTSFYAPGQRRWFPFAYGSLAVIIALIMLGYVTQSIIVIGDRLYPHYNPGIYFLFAALMALASRNIYLFIKRLKVLNNAVMYNQIVSLLLGISALAVFTLTALLPWGREFPISHFGNLLNAFILSYATIRHQLVDIRAILRQGLAWVSLGVIGAAVYGTLFVLLRVVLRFNIDLRAELVATVLSVVVSIFVYHLRSFLFVTMGRAFQGQSYDYRQKLSAFANRIHNVFSLKEQGAELLALVTRAVGSQRACLLFPELGGQDFTAQAVEPEGLDNPLSSLRLTASNPVVEYLAQERTLLTRENLTIMPELLSLWEQEREEINSSEIDLFVPLISRGRLIAILVLGKKQSGKYSLEDFGLLEDIANRVAVSMEKEYIREQLRDREEELSVINRSSAVLASSLDIPGIYDSFVGELRNVIDVSWSAIVLIEKNDLLILTLSSEVGSAWQIGERVPIKGSATELVAATKKPLVEPDLSRESLFNTGQYHIRQGIRSIAYLPLISADDEVIGSLVVGSRSPHAYSPRHISLLERLSAQIAVSVENARLYARAEEEARVDELTGLLNRRSLDEMIASEIGRHSRYGGIFSIIILDLDSFKTYNDSYGHLAGDKLLKQIGGVIKGAIRNADQAFRYGGDEFAILLPHTAIDSASRVAERVRRQVEAKAKGGLVSITASLGLANWPTDGIGASEIVSAADGALYRAKRSGGNRSYCASGTLMPLDDVPPVPANKNDGGILSTIFTLAATVDARDHYTRSHSKKVSELALALAEALHLEPLEVSRVETCAMLHDIGKIGISDEILNKPGELTAEEWEAVRAHPQLGATIAGRVQQLAPCIDGIRHHHERYDGSGYPSGLKGEAIPLEARILAIADAFAAMTSARHYSAPLSNDEALDELKKGAGTQFDPRLVEVFVSVVAQRQVAAGRQGGEGEKPEIA